MQAMARSLVAAVAAVCVVLSGAGQAASNAPQAAGMEQSSKGLTEVPGIKVGHVSLSERPTGCTVVLAEAGAVAAVDIRGAAPATRETDLLNPVNSVQIAHAIVLSGGSAFGLDTASGVMRHLEEKKIGFAFGSAHVPIVPAAALFDLRLGDGRVRPTAECGYQAARLASTDAVAEGNVGAGAGATVGKASGMTAAMKGGVGSASLSMPDGLIVAALVVTNSLGDVVDPATGRIVAGARAKDGKTFADARVLLRSGAIQFSANENTTLAVVATNATLTKTDAKRIAEMAHDGFARAIVPSHTPVDGDTIFTLATGTRAGRADTGLIGIVAADVVAHAIIRSVRAAHSIPGIPAARDFP
jgi:L-aminopeptidase/D-esterase-like protein